LMQGNPQGFGPEPGRHRNWTLTLCYPLTPALSRLPLIPSHQGRGNQPWVVLLTILKRNILLTTTLYAGRSSFRANHVWGKFDGAERFDEQAEIMGIRQDRPKKLGLVGTTGFEPATPASRTLCSTRLSHVPTPCLFLTLLHVGCQAASSQASLQRGEPQRL
jgi:hypothetical protein